MILAEDVYASMDIPAFPQSSMDGYAFSFDGWKKHKKLKIAGEVAAGSNETFTLAPKMLFAFLPVQQFLQVPILW